MFIQLGSLDKFRKQIEPIFIACLLALLLSACSDPQPRRLRQEKVIDIVWETLAPNTSTQSRSKWEIVDARKTTGRQVVNEFGINLSGKCFGPRPPENLPIRAAAEYWYVKAVPSHLAQPSADPNSVIMIEEPILKEAAFLVDPYTGQVVAQRYYCGE